MKKSITLISLFLITSALAYSHSLGVGLYIPLGGSIPSLYQNDNLDPTASLSPKTAFEVGVIFNPRVTFDIDKYNRVSIGIDVGWYRDTFKFQTGSQNFTHEFDTVMTGLNFRWSPSLFVLGIGGGVKFPFLGKYWTGNNNVALNGGHFSSRFNNAVIPYVRFSLDFSIFNYWMIGVYANYDFPLHFQHNNYISDTIINNNSLSALDIGIQFGYYINIDFNK